VRHYFLAKVISASLILMYGVVPYFLSVMDLYEVPYAELNFLYSIIASLFIYVLPVTINNGFFSNIHGSLMLKDRIVGIIFVFALILFQLFPWHQDRESFGASLAALFRAAWLLVMFASTQRSEKYKIKIFILSIVLMFVDESRTYFMVGLLVLSSSSTYRNTLVVLGVFLVIILAAVRMSISDNSLNFLFYGIVGESYNATRSVGQVLAVDNQQINTMGHLFQIYFQPILFPFEFVATRVLDYDFPTQNSYLSDIVSSGLNEQLSPMGGWYIVADFVYYGYLGIFLLLLYLLLNWFLTCYIFNTPNFPFGSFLFFLSIKSTPYVYWKMLYYLIFIFYAIKVINKLVLVGKSKGLIN
jgi:hypothetical protein